MFEPRFPFTEADKTRALELLQQLKKMIPAQHPRDTTTSERLMSLDATLALVKSHLAQLEVHIGYLHRYSNPHLVRDAKKRFKHKDKNL